jgi:hypothetical protein
MNSLCEDILYKERNLKNNCSVQINEYIELSGLNEMKKFYLVIISL